MAFRSGGEFESLGNVDRRGGACGGMEEPARGMAVSRRKTGWVINQQVGKRKIRPFRPY